MENLGLTTASYQLALLFRGQLSEMKDIRRIPSVLSGYVSLCEEVLNDPTNRDKFQNMVVNLEAWETSMAEQETERMRNNRTELAEILGIYHKRKNTKNDHVSTRQFNDLKNEFIIPAAKIFRELNDKFDSGEFDSFFLHESQKQSIPKFVEFLARSFADASQYLEDYIQTHSDEKFRRPIHPSENDIPKNVIPFPRSPNEPQR